MKPAWDELGTLHKDSTSVVIGDADCTASGKDLCEQFEVRGYPTIKYFTDETGDKGKDYSGGRGIDDLKKFVTETLAKKCDVKDQKDCDEKEKKFIGKMQKKGAADIKKQLERLEKMKGGKMKPELKTWLFKRINVLKQL